MPGIFGGVNSTTNKPSEDLATNMSSRLEHGEDWFGARWLLYSLGFHGVTDFKSRLVKDIAASQTKNAVIYGDIYSWGDLKISNEHQVETILSLYEKQGLDFLKHLNGSFVISIYDGEKDKVMIVNDRYGSKNLFYTINKDGLLYSSEIKAILAEPSIKPKLNPKAVTEFFIFSYVLGNKTLFEGIELLPPASILLYDCKEHKVQIDTYLDFELNRDKEPKSLETYLKEFESLMEKAMERRMADKDKLGIFLSGGLDSRLMTGFAKRVADKRGKELVTFTFGTKGGWQEKIAKQVAEKLDIDNRFYEIPPDFIANYAEEVVYKGDGHIRIRDAHFVSVLSKVRSEVDTILVGFFCSELFGEVLSADILQVSTKDELVDYLFNKYRIKQTAKHVPEIFSLDLRSDLEEAARTHFIETVEEIPFESYDEIADCWELRQRDRRYIIPLSNYMNWYLDTRVPYLDNEVAAFAVNLPAELRFEKRFIHKALKHIFPNLAKIPWEKSGVVPDTTGLPLMLSKSRRFASMQFRSLIERISLGKILFKPVDYRGYDYWLRTGSRKYVEDTLINGTSEYFDRQYIRKIVEEHMRAKKSHDQIICDVLDIYLVENIFLKSGK